MGLTAPGIPEGQDVFSPLYEGSIPKSFELVLKFKR